MANPSTMSAAQLKVLKAQYNKISKIDPSSASYKGMIALLDAMPLPMLQQIADAEIKFLSSLALNRVNRKSKETAAINPLLSLMGDTSAKLSLTKVKADLKKLNVTIEYDKDNEEYRVNIKNGKEATAYYTNDLEDAFSTGQHMSTMWAPKTTKKGMQDCNAASIYAALAETASSKSAFIPATPALVKAFKDECKKRGLQTTVRTIKSGSSQGYINVTLKKATPPNYHLLYSIAVFMRMATGGTIPKPVDKVDERAIIGSTSTFAFTENSKFAVSMADTSEAVIAPSAALLALTVEKARNGNELTTYELAPLLKRLAHSDLSSDDIAERFTDAFADVLLKQD